jgi:hypothetical protein
MMYLIGRTDQVEGSPEALQLGDLYQSLTDRLTKDAQGAMPLDDSLNPSHEMTQESLIYLI